MEVRNAVSQAIGDGRYLQLDGSNTATKFNTPYQKYNAYTQIS